MTTKNRGGEVSQTGVTVEKGSPQFLSTSLENCALWKTPPSKVRRSIRECAQQPGGGKWRRKLTENNQKKDLRGANEKKAGEGGFPRPLLVN